MCKAKDEGGQRCAAHARKGLEAAQKRYDSSGSQDDLHALIAAHVEYASTPEGQDAVQAAFANGDPAPGELPAEMWQRIADDGAALRERNQAVAEAIKAAAAKGDAFHKDVREKWGETRHVPGSVRGPKSLAAFLEHENHKLRFATEMITDRTERAQINQELINEITAAPVTPDATADQRLPRSEEERAAWLQRLNQRRDHYTAFARMGLEEVRKHNARMAKFNHPGVPEGTKGLPANPERAGYLARIKNPDGTLSEKNYIVTRVSENSPHVDAEGVTTVMLMELTEHPGGTDEYGIKQPGAHFCGESARSDNTGTGSPYVFLVDRIAPADEATTARYGGRLNTSTFYDRTITAHDEPNEVIAARTIAEDERYNFDRWRIDQASRGPKPYQTLTQRQEAAANRDAGIGGRIRNLFGN